MKKLFADHQGHTDVEDPIDINCRVPEAGREVNVRSISSLTQKDCPCKSLAAETRTANETRTADSILELIDVSSR